MLGLRMKQGLNAKGFVQRLADQRYVGAATNKHHPQRASDAWIEAGSRRIHQAGPHEGALTRMDNAANQQKPLDMAALEGLFRTQERERQEPCLRRRINLISKVAARNLHTSLLASGGQIQTVSFAPSGSSCEL